MYSFQSYFLQQRCGSTNPQKDIKHLSIHLDVSSAYNRQLWYAVLPTRPAGLELHAGRLAQRILLYIFSLVYSPFSVSFFYCRKFFSCCYSTCKDVTGVIIEEKKELHMCNSNSNQLQSRKTNRGWQPLPSCIETMKAPCS